MAGTPAPPELVEVVASDDIELAMAAVAAELEELAGELATLRRRADEAERRAASGHPDGTERSHGILEQVFAGRAAAMRREMDAALTEARSAADARVAAARRQAATMTRERPAPTVAAPLRAASAAPRSRPVDLVADVAPLTLVDARPVRPPAAGVVQERRASVAPSPAEAPLAPRPAPPPAGPQPSGSDDQFDQFWVGAGVERAERAEPAPAARFAVLDVILPVIAAGILFVIILSWVG